MQGSIDSAQAMSRVLSESWVKTCLKRLHEKDPATAGHSLRVMAYAWQFALSQGLDFSEARQYALAGLFHDVGKLEIEPQILSKQAPLDEVEWSAMRQHPLLADPLSTSAQGDEEIFSAMRYHHERWDGRGYPFGLQGDQIPKLARAISVLDAFDAIRSKRPYKSAVSSSQAVEFICDEAGKQFCPQTVKHFVAWIDSPRTRF